MDVVTLHGRHTEYGVEGEVTFRDLRIWKMFRDITVGVELIGTFHVSAPGSLFDGLLLARWQDLDDNSCFFLGSSIFFGRDLFFGSWLFSRRCIGWCGIFLLFSSWLCFTFTFRWLCFSLSVSWLSIRSLGGRCLNFLLGGGLGWFFFLLGLLLIAHNQVLVFQSVSRKFKFIYNNWAPTNLI